MAARRRKVEEAKFRVRQKLSDIEQQRDAFIQYFQEINRKTDEALRLGRDLLGESVHARVLQRYMGVMQTLEQCLGQLFLVQVPLAGDADDLDECEDSNEVGDAFTSENLLTSTAVENTQTEEHIQATTQTDSITSETDTTHQSEHSTQTVVDTVHSHSNDQSNHSTQTLLHSGKHCDKSASHTGNQETVCQTEHATQTEQASVFTTNQSQGLTQADIQLADHRQRSRSTSASDVTTVTQETTCDPAAHTENKHTESQKFENSPESSVTDTSKLEKTVTEIAMTQLSQTAPVSSPEHTGNTEAATVDTDLVSEDVYGLGPMIPVLDICEGQYVEVMVTEIMSPFMFWVQPVSNVLENLSTQLDFHYNKQHQELSLKCEPRIGMVVCVLFTVDDTWYRARILHVNRKDKKVVESVGVFYLDYGNQESVPMDRVCTLEKDFAALPCQAFCCALHEAAPPDSQKLWTQPHTVAFANLVINKQIPAIVSVVPRCSVVFLDLTFREESLDMKEPSHKITFYNISSIMVGRNFARKEDNGHIASIIQETLLPRKRLRHFSQMVLKDLVDIQAPRILKKESSSQQQFPLSFSQEFTGSDYGATCGAKTEAQHSAQVIETGSDDAEAKAWNEEFADESFDDCLQHEIEMSRAASPCSNVSNDATCRKPASSTSPEVRLSSQNAESQSHVLSSGNASRRSSTPVEGQSVEDVVLKSLNIPVSLPKQFKSWLKEKHKDMGESFLKQTSDKCDLQRKEPSSSDAMATSSTENVTTHNDKHARDGIDRLSSTGEGMNKPDDNKMSNLGSSNYHVKNPVLTSSTDIDSAYAECSQSSAEMDRNVKSNNPGRKVDREKRSPSISKSSSASDQSLSGRRTPSDYSLKSSGQSKSNRHKQQPQGQHRPEDCELRLQTRRTSKECQKPEESSNQSVGAGSQSGESNRRSEGQVRRGDCEHVPTAGGDHKPGAKKEDKAIANAAGKSATDEQNQALSDSSQDQVPGAGRQENVCDERNENSAVDPEHKETSSSKPVCDASSPSEKNTKSQASPAASSSDKKKTKKSKSRSKSASTSSKSRPSASTPDVSLVGIVNYITDSSSSENYRNTTSETESKSSTSSNNSSRGKSSSETQKGAQEKTLSPLTINVPEDGFLSVLMSSIQSPMHFYVHLITKESQAALDQLMNELSEYYRQEKNREQNRYCDDADLATHTPCCAQFSEDDRFYRAEIVDTRMKTDVNGRSSESNKVKVLYVDFGNSEWVPLSRIYRLHDSFFELPMQAVLCTLAGISLVTLPESDQHKITEAELAKEAHEAFLEKTGYEKILLACLASAVDQSTNRKEGIPVYLMDTTGDDDICVNADMVRLGYARLVSDDFHDPTLYKITKQTEPSHAVVTKEEDLELDTASAHLKNWDPMVEEFLSERNSYEVDVDDPGVAAVGYKAKDEHKICRNFMRTGRCRRGDFCPFIHVRDSGGVTNDRAEVFCLNDTENSLALPEEDAWVAVEVSAVFNPAHFYVIFPCGTKSLAEHMKEDSNTDEGYEDSTGSSCENVDSLMENMNDFYSTKTLRDRDLTVHALGEIVAARYTFDDCWYRARVVETEAEKHMVQVFYVDFGNSEWLNESRIRQMEPHYLSLPFQALECFLPLDPVSANGKWSAESRELFRELTDGHILFAHVLSRSFNKILTVDLYNTTNGDIHINQKLLDRGYAKEPKKIISTRDDVKASKQIPEVKLIPG